MPGYAGVVSPKSDLLKGNGKDSKFREPQEEDSGI